MNQFDHIREIKTNLRRLFKFTEQVFNNYTLTDKRVITSPDKDLQVGSDIYLLDDQGNQTTLDAGSYVLEDGRTIIVDELGKITTINDAQADPEAVETGDSDTDSVETSKQKMDANGLPEGHGPAAQSDAPSEPDPVDPGVDLAKRVEDLEKIVNELMNMMNKVGDSTNDLNEQMMSMAGEPGDRPIKQTRRGYVAYDKTEAINKKKADNTMDIIKMVNEINKKKTY